LHAYPASIKYPTPEFFIIIRDPLTSLRHLSGVCHSTPLLLFMGIEKGKGGFAPELFFKQN
jgi:hypothetical protein